MVDERASIGEHLGDPDFMRAYSEWLKNPVTQRIAKLLAQASKPLGLTQVDGDNALYAHGITVGCTLASEFVTGLEIAAKRRAVAQEAQPEADYGMEEILQDWGYLPRKVKGNENG
jgi:hypothetical protein